MSKISQEEQEAIMAEFSAYTKKWLAEKNLGSDYAIMQIQVMQNEGETNTSIMVEWDGEEGISRNQARAMMIGTAKVMDNFKQQIEEGLSSNKPTNE